MDQKNVVNPHNGALFSHKEGNPALYSSRDGTGFLCISEVTQAKQGNEKKCWSQENWCGIVVTRD